LWQKLFRGLSVQPTSPGRTHIVVGKILLILGILGMLLGGAVTVVSALLPTITEGRTSMDEALIGIIPGALLLVGAFIMTVAGLILVLMKKKKVVVAG